MKIVIGAATAQGRMERALARMDRRWYPLVWKSECEQTKFACCNTTGLWDFSEEVWAATLVHWKGEAILEVQDETYTESVKTIVGWIEQQTGDEITIVVPESPATV